MVDQDRAIAPERRRRLATKLAQDGALNQLNSKRNVLGVALTVRRTDEVEEQDGRSAEKHQPRSQHYENGPEQK